MSIFYRSQYGIGNLSPSSSALAAIRSSQARRSLFDQFKQGNTQSALLIATLVLACLLALSIVCSSLYMLWRRRARVWTSTESSKQPARLLIKSDHDSADLEKGLPRRIPACLSPPLESIPEDEEVHQFDGTLSSSARSSRKLRLSSLLVP